MTKITAKQEFLITQFIATAKTNGVSHLFAALPRTHFLLKDKKVRQIRVVTDALASGLDELGNYIVLTPEGLVKQM